LRHLEPEHAPLGGAGAHTQAPVVRLHDFLDGRQPETESGLPGGMQPPERLEDALLVSRRDSRTVVFNLDARRMNLFTVSHRDASRQLRAFDDEFGRIADEIGEYGAERPGRARQLERRYRHDRELYLNGLEPRPYPRHHGV